MHRRRRHLLGLAAAAPTLAPAALARAQGSSQGSSQGGDGWPGRQPIRLIVTFPPGGLADTVSRLVTPAMGAALGQSILIENRAGAGGTIGADMAAKAAPDGYTLVVSHASPHGIAPGIYPALPYDPVGDFSHLAMLCDTGNALMVPAASPYRTLGDYLEAAKGGGGLRYGSSGVGSITHLMGEVLAQEAGLPRLEHVPYRGSAPALQDMLAGRIESLFDPLTTYVAMLKDGTLRALAVSTPGRSPALPAVPTFAELGLPRLTCTTWIGVSGPKGLPEATAARLTEAAVGAVARPDLRARLADLASHPPPLPLTGAAYAGMIGGYVREWTGVARSAGITAA
jgi:tripartite-type tricarboxylate transporter receptor subunit TctC